MSLSFYHNPIFLFLVIFVTPVLGGQSKPIFLFSDDKYLRYPDFYNDTSVLDAKYKHLEFSSELERNDIHQIITYMHVLGVKIGGFIYPHAEAGRDKSVGENSYHEIQSLGELKGLGGSISKIRFNIPIGNENYELFKSHINSNESQFIENITHLLTQ